METPIPVPPGLPPRPPSSFEPYAPHRSATPYPSTPLPPPPPQPKRDRRAAPWLIATLIGLVAGLAGAALALALADDDSPQRIANPVPIVRPADEVAGEPLDVGEIVAKVQPSVVNITVQSSDGISIGTGVIMTATGEVLTNAHVVSDADNVQVRLVGETEPRHGTVVATDPRNDLALVRIDNATGLTPIELAQPGDIQVGDDVVAMGYALDLDGGPSVTKGIVSGLGRTLDTGDEVLDGLIQTDAAISSGNSGGPLVNNRGQLVGINTAVARDGPDFAANNIGFAISLAEALPKITDMRAGKGEAPLPFLGVKIEDRTDGGGGALITEVVPGAPADQAGIKTGDIVVSVNGRPVDGADGLIAAIRDASPGDQLQLNVERNGAITTVTATVRERNDND